MNTVTTAPTAHERPLQHLLTPIDLGPFELPLRLFCTGHTPCYSHDGLISDQEIAYHVRKAEGGIPLSTTGITAVHPSGGGPAHHMLTNVDDTVLPAYQKLAEAMHTHGARMMVQLSHLGSSFASGHLGHPTWAPSAVTGDYAREVPHVLTTAEIDTLLDAFYKAAVRVRHGGLDGVEYMAFAGALPIQFLSPYTNKRTDAYGGGLENRMRFLLESLRLCREAVGPDRALSLKIAGDELVDGGLRLPDVQQIVRRVDATGLVDWYVVIAGNNLERFARVDHWPPTPAPEALHAQLAAGIKAVTTRPVAALGRIVTPAVADRLIAEGTCDLVAMVRAAIADPDLPTKVRAGRLADVRPCVGSNVCIDRTLDGGPMRCIHNPIIGREQEWGHPSAAPQVRRVLVVGGGPAGLEAARLAAERGHRVTLVERAAQLGGAAVVTARQPGREELIGITRWMISQVHRCGVAVHLHTEATKDAVLALQPDVVIVAAGARDRAPAEAGPAAGLPVVSAWAVLNGDMEVGRNVVIIDQTGKQIGCAVAEVVADRGGRAEVVSSHFHPAMDVGLTNTVSLYRRLFRKGVTLTPHHTLHAVRDGLVTIGNSYNGAERVIEGLDLLVIVTTPIPNDALVSELMGSGVEVHAVGDCIAPRDIETATFEAHRAALHV